MFGFAWYSAADNTMQTNKRGSEFKETSAFMSALIQGMLISYI